MDEATRQLDSCRFPAERPLKHGGSGIMKLLSFSLCYPNPSDPKLGIFVQRRLQSMAALPDCELRVVSPVPVFDYANGWAGNEWFGSKGVPLMRKDGGVEIRHPRYLYPPGGDFTNAFFLAASAWRTVHRMHGEFPFDLIDAHFAFPEGVAASWMAKRLSIPYTITMRGNELLNGGYPLRRKYMAAALRGAARVLAVSGELRDYAVALGVDPARTHVVPNGVDTAVFHDAGGARRAGERTVFLSAGHLIELKGHHRSIEALAILLRQGADAELRIAGEAGRAGRFEPELRALPAKLGIANRVTFLGAIPQLQLAEEMRNADGFVLSSSREGWPNVVQEALACGTPVVSASVGAAPDMVAEGTGILVPPNDVGALADGMRELIARSWNRAAIARWGQRRGWDRVALDVRKILGEALGGERESGSLWRSNASF